jgi:hypothetical protein
MRITQGTFSFLPDLTDEQIAAQVDYALAQGWAVSVEYTDDPHPRNTYWEMWGLPMFDLKDAAGVLVEIRECRKVHHEREHAAVVHGPPAAGRGALRAQARGKRGTAGALHARARLSAADEAGRPRGRIH